MSREPNPSTSPSGSAAGPLDPQSVEGIFIESLGKAPGPARNEFLETACQGNDDLRTRVEALLRAYSDAGSFLNQPAGDWRHPPFTTAAGSPSVNVDEHGIPRGLLQPSNQPGVLGTIGPYHVRELIGRGGMGIVFRAFDAKLNRIVAVKVLAPELAAQPTARRRFLREAQAAAAVTHPHVVTIHAVDEDEWPHLVMECIDGCSLEDKIARTGTLKLAEVLRIGTQIADGLAAAHKQGLIHRDVKPANILLENGVERVKITDFGLARAADDVTITRPGEISGTPQYMSPEQASGQRVDQRSDLFSLGCVLYAMCAGQPPFRADSMAAIVKKICDDVPQPLREIDPQLPDWMAEVIERLLSKDPNQRFQTAGEVSQMLGDALARLQAGQAAVAPVVRPTVVAAPVANRASMETWEKVLSVILVVSCVIAMRAPIQIPGTGAGAAIGFAEIFVPIVVFWITRMDSMSSTRRVLLTVLVFFLGWAIGYNLWFHHTRFRTGDWFAALGMLPVSCLLTYRLFRGAATSSATSALGGFSRSRAERGFRRNKTAGAARRWHRQPWTLAGWLLAGLLSLVFLVPIVGAIAVLIPAYQARQYRQDLQASYANMGHLTMTFDQDLPIVDIQIDGSPWNTSRGAMAPVQGKLSVFCTPGPHAVTVTYSHGDRQRSVHQAVKLASGEERTLDLTPLVRADMQERVNREDSVSTGTPSASPKAIRSFRPADEPISSDAKWVGDELKVKADRPGPVRLFEVPLEKLDHSLLRCRFHIKADELASSAYAEMHCRVPGFGEPFSRGLDQKVQGTGGWMTDEMRFFLRKGEFADLVKLNLVFEGPGEVRMKDIELLATPLPAEAQLPMGGPAPPAGRGDRAGGAPGLPASPSASPRLLRTLRDSDKPIATGAEWIGDELEVTAAEAGSVRLFEVPLARVEQSVIAYRFRIKAEELASSAYAEMWCRVQGFGEFFSRGLDKQVYGNKDWMTVEIPFFLEKDQFADLVKLNLVFRGPGTVRMKDIELLVTPLPADVQLPMGGPTPGLPAAPAGSGHTPR